MSDSAVGPISGYLFQFEKALVLLATLENPTDFVSLEKVDDVAVHTEDDAILMTIQSKHSISANGTTFQDTSKSLWRTLEIWVDKLENRVFNEKTQFICSTNKVIDDESLIKKIMDKDIEEVISEINNLLLDQKKKLTALKLNANNKDKIGPSITKTISLIEYILSKPNQFEIIKNNLVIQDKEELAQRFYNAIHMSTDDYTQARKEATYEAMYGWILSRCQSKWLNSKDATFSKKDFDSKLASINNNSAIVNAVFRKKSWLGSIDAKKILDTKKELFVTQIEDIQRNQSAKERKIEEAVKDFIYHDIEMSHIISKGNFTETDFDYFKKNCREKWQKTFDHHVIMNLEDYDDNAKNNLAIKIFDEVMDSIDVNFQDGISFNSSNRYIHNGTFLKLSNVPNIGWHPDWESKYIK